MEKCSGSLSTATQAFYGSGNKWLRWALFSRHSWEYVNSHNENAEECLRPEVEREYSARCRKEDCLNNRQLQYTKWGQNYKWHTSIRCSPKKTQSYRPWTKQCCVKMFSYHTQDVYLPWYGYMLLNSEAGFIRLTLLFHNVGVSSVVGARRSWRNRLSSTVCDIWHHQLVPKWICQKIYFYFCCHNLAIVKQLWL